MGPKFEAFPKCISRDIAILVFFVLFLPYFFLLNFWIYTKSYTEHQIQSPSPFSIESIWYELYSSKFWYWSDGWFKSYSCMIFIYIQSIFFKKGKGSFRIILPKDFFVISLKFIFLTECSRLDQTSQQISHRLDSALLFESVWLFAFLTKERFKVCFWKNAFFRNLKKFVHGEDSSQEKILLLNWRFRCALSIEFWPETRNSKSDFWELFFWNTWPMSVSALKNLCLPSLENRS